MTPDTLAMAVEIHGLAQAAEVIADQVSRPPSPESNALAAFLPVLVEKAKALAEALDAATTSAT